MPSSCTPWSQRGVWKRNGQNLEKTLGQVFVQEFKFLVTVLSHGCLRFLHTVLPKQAPPIIRFLWKPLSSFSKLLSFHCCHSVKRKLTTMSRQLSYLATQGHILILTCFWSWLIESDYVKPVTNVVCHFWNANKTILFSKVLGVIDVKIYSNIIHFLLCFSRIDVISFHALLNTLKGLKKHDAFCPLRSLKRRVFFFLPSALDFNNVWSLMNLFN